MGLRAQVGGRVVQLAAGLITRVPPSLTFPELTVAEKRVHRVATDAGEVVCTSYHPVAPAGAGSVVPGVHVNFHGGGYVMRRPEQDDPLCRYIAHHAGCVVVNVDYDVAPQHPFPTAVHQAYGVCRWAAAQGAAHGWDGARLSVGGQSAGGGLAAAACRLARDSGAFTPRLQALVYPPVDLTIPPERKRGLADRPMISPGISRLFNEAYTPDPASRTDPLVSPGARGDLEGLPPALIITAELDTLRDEGDRFAKALSAAGVPVTHRVFEGVDHAFTHREPVAPAQEALALIARSVRAALTA